MGFTDEVRNRLNSLVGQGSCFPNKKRMADTLEVDPSQLNRFLSGERGLTVDSLGRILDKLGARVAFSDDPAETAREVSFVTPQPARRCGGAPGPSAGDYIAVPLVSAVAAAGPELIPEDRIDGWLLVWRHHEAVRERANLVAVRIGEGETAMAPTLHPGDMVLVDRNERKPDPPGKIMLVCGPAGDDSGIHAWRVATHRAADDLELIFYSDNCREVPPRVHRLQRDYGGDLGRAIVGAVVWSWSDMTRK